jgi:hypothetical protein
VAIKRAYAHAAQGCNNNGSRVGGTRAGRCPYAGVGVVSGTGEGGIQVSTRCIEGRQCTVPTRLCTCTRAVLRRALDGVLSAVSAQPAERVA